MKIRKSYQLLLVVLTLAVFVISGCGTDSTENESSGESSTAGGTLTMGLSAEPATMDPMVQNGTSGRTIKLSIYRGLYNYNAEGEKEPELASSYEANEELTEYIFTLRDASFHNGDPVTPEDVKFTFERIIDEESTATYKNELSIIQEIETDTENNTVTFKLSESSPAFVDYLCLPESVIVSKSYTEGSEGILDTEPMGAGPFKFVSWTQGSEFVVEKFDDYYKEDTPKLDSVDFVFYTDDTTRVNALRSGDVDLIEYVPWSDTASLQEDSSLNVDSVSGPFMMLQFNTSSGPLSDPAVRQAIAYAIDRQTIIDTAFSGEGEAIYGMALLEGYMGYTDEVNSYFEYDVDKAKELLAEAGYPDGFSIKLLATSQYSYHEQTAVAVQQELEKAGITVELELPDWATRTSLVTSGDYDMVVSGTSGDITDGDWLSNFYLGSDEPSLNKAAYFNDEELNTLLQQAKTETDSEAREQLYEEIVDRAMEESPFVFLNWRAQSYAMSSQVEGFTNIEGFLSFQSGLTIEDTYIAE